jgi:hypothetical protein
MSIYFEYFANLQYKVKTQTAQLKAFESGEKYVKMRTEFHKQLSQKNRTINKLKTEVAAANTRTITVREYWSEIFDDLEKEHAKEQKKKDARIVKLEKLLLEAQIKIDEWKTKFIEKNKELYQVKAELEEETDRTKKLKSQLNRDYENSSLPSSASHARKKIQNNREKTNKTPGGQQGHEGHRRKRLEPTKIIRIPAPKKYTDDPHYKPTGKTVSKQVINLRISTSVDEYVTPEFRNTKTGQRVHAEFPEGIVNDVSYGEGVKAFAFLLNSYCCVSIDKVREFLSELTDGKINISKGMVNGLCGVFSRKTETQRRKAFVDLQYSPVMNTDCTSARVDGKNACVIVCATPGKALYLAREHKGFEGVKGTPVEDYQGTLVHDHDVTFYHYGTGHQECLIHVLRYLKASMENEPDLKWNRQMRKLIQEMIHYRNGLSPGETPNVDRVNGFEDRYKAILKIAKKEYEFEPPSKYNRDGYNLYVRLGEYMENHLLFLHDMNIPSNNNLSERLLRVFKRKQKQVMTLRSFENFDYLCNCISVINSLRTDGRNLFASVSAIFQMSST